MLEEDVTYVLEQKVMYHAMVGEEARGRARGAASVGAVDVYVIVSSILRPCYRVVDVEYPW